MTIDKIIEKIKEKLKNAPQIGAKIKVILEDTGVIFIDGMQFPCEISQEDHDADTTFVCSVEIFEKILDGTQDPTVAYMMGRLKIRGSMGYAMKLSSLLGD